MNQNVGVISHFECAYECIIICHPSALRHVQIFDLSTWTYYVNYLLWEFVLPVHLLDSLLADTLGYGINNYIFDMILKSLLLHT